MSDGPKSARPEVVIVGAGVAGMTAALRLLQAGFRVHLIEKADHPGGQFDAISGAGPDGSHYHEHSYHFFANWCVNFWDIVNIA